jgi:hypothetical protein
MRLSVWMREQPGIAKSVRRILKNGKLRSVFGHRSAAQRAALTLVGL